MTVFKRGDVILVGFVFSDGSGEKLRPALVISSSAHNRVPSIATGILRTVTREMLDRKLGVMAKGDLDAVDSGLRRSLAL